MSALNMTTFEAALKVHYTDLRVKNLVYRNNPWLAAIPKMEAFGGKMLPLPLQVGVPQGRSATFTDAQIDKTPGVYKDFQLTRIRNYGLAAIQNEVLEASVGNANAFMQAAASEIDGILRALTQDLAGGLYADGTGSRGTIGALAGPPPATVITLANSTDVVRFEVQMKLMFQAVLGTDIPNGPIEIIAVDRDLGTITVDNTVGMALAVNQFMFQNGDEPQTPTEKLKITGLEGWLPGAAPVAGDDFFGVDRSSDPTRLAGIRYDGVAETIEEAMIGAGALLFREGGRPDVIFMNPLTYSELIKSLGSKVVYDLMRSSDVADVFFEAVRIHLPSGSAMVVADPNCPSGRAYMLQMDTWKMYSLGMAPKILMTDGLRFLRENNADAVEVRAGYYAQMGCTAPGWNATIALST
ncbi:MAG: phage major capsid protein [bacterium]|nr:phage major capsid protein [bacterium]